MFKPKAIGTVSTPVDKDAPQNRIKDAESIIDIHEPYGEGLFMIDSCSYLDVIFYFHQSRQAEDLKKGDKGVFTTRSPHRPNPIGVTTVKLNRRKGSRLYVTGLDAINGTPVLDIKPPDSSLHDFGRSCDIHFSTFTHNPRMAVDKQIQAGDTKSLLLQAGQMHGHYCPGLAMGIMASVYAMQKLEAQSDGLEDLLAITETNNCFSDGVQLVTGCSFGNNALIFHDTGKMAFTLTRRTGSGLRVIARHDSRDSILSAFPEFEESYEKVVRQQVRDEKEIALFRKRGIERAFGTLSLDFDLLFDTKENQVQIPEYAPSHKSILCAQCGESVMASRVVTVEGNQLCLPCSGSPFAILDGNGMHP